MHRLHTVCSRSATVHACCCCNCLTTTTTTTTTSTTSTPVQDLELWITKETVADGYNLAVRAGKVVQEVIVGTDMGLDDMRSTVQRVLRSIN
jgi:hypothetical protein